MDGKLDPQARDSALATMTAPDAVLDVLVVGGGIVGAGSALDAVTRGLNVGLIEMRDWASGTSSRSSKLIHGGLRYLEMLDFRLVREALHERSLLLDRIAPHLVHRVPFLYPLRHRGWERLYVGAGLTLYDTFGWSHHRRRDLPMHRQLTKRAVRRIAPAVNIDKIVGAVQYYDAQVDDARYVINTVRTAAAYGAQVANRVQVIGFLRDGDRVTGALVRDLESKIDFEIRAKVVVNATGVWTDDIQQLTGGRGALKVQASKGIHLVVPRDRIRSSTGMIMKTHSSVLFVIPWGRHWIIGTTDTAWDLDKSHPAASASDIDYVLEQVNGLLNSPLTLADVEGCYAGLRPLLAGESDATSKLSREHTVVSPLPGLVLVAGGKFTTYRVMAADAVDAAVRSLGGLLEQSITTAVPLLGADGYLARWNQRHLLARRSNLPVARVEHLLNRYGAMADQLLDMIIADPALGDQLPGAEDYLAVEIVYAVTHEGARHLTDILARRTRISIETWDRGVGVAPIAADLVADLLGWDDRAKSRQISVYLRRVEAERMSQTRADDWSANTERTKAKEHVEIAPFPQSS